LTLNRRHSERGQSVVEFALVLPILVFLMVGIIDLARIYTTMLSVESAAREAADYGAFGAARWANPTVVVEGQSGPPPVPGMRERACIAASDLTDYVGPDSNCSNPSFSYTLLSNGGSTPANPDDCKDPALPAPCWVRVDLTYNFKLLVPLNFQLFGVTYGLPTALTFTRSSMFAMTDLTLPPTPPPAPVAP
jgi:hypothetical protein